MSPNACVPVGLVYALIAYGLTRGLRWLAYLAFIVTMVGGTLALGTLWTNSSAALGSVLIIATDWLAALALFITLCRPAPAIRDVS